MIIKFSNKFTEPGLCTIFIVNIYRTFLKNNSYPLTPIISHDNPKNKKRGCMDLFLSQFVNRIDKKGRITLPSVFRNVLPKKSKNEIILFKSSAGDSRIIFDI